MDCLFLMRPLQLAFLRHFRPTSRPPGPSCPAFTSGEDTLSSLVISGFPPSGEAVQPSPSRPHSDHGCLQSWLGWFFTPSSSFGPLVSSGVSSPHQHAGTESGVFSSPGFCRPGLRPLRLSQVRQLDCSVLHQSPGRHSLDPAVSFYTPSTHLVSSEEDHSVCLPHSRSTESCRGLSFQGEFPSVEMVSSPLGFSVDHSGQSSPTGGSLRLLPQSSSSTLLCEDRRPERLGSGHVLHPLVGLPRVCVPSIPPHPEGARESCSRPGGPPFGGSVLTQETLVSTPPVSSGFSRAPAATSLVSSSGSLESSSYSLAALQSLGRQAGLSLRAADLAARCLRASSRSTYDSRLVAYFGWCQHLARIHIMPL